jgi:hypothetical protein
MLILSVQVKTRILLQGATKFGFGFFILGASGRPLASFFFTLLLAIRIT